MESRARLSSGRHGSVIIRVTLATATYNGAGQPLTFSTRKQDGTYDVANYTYNSRGQLTAQVGRGANIEHRYSTTANDGRLTSRKDNISGEEVSYQYDELGRLIAAATKGTAPTVSLGVNPATNRISTSGFVYDAAGNLTAWPVGNETVTAWYTYENQMRYVTTPAGSESYSYTVAGQRARQGRTGMPDRYCFYGLRGELLGIYGSTPRANGTYYISTVHSTRVWLGGLLVSSDGNAITRDQLGSVVNSGTETLSYYPYGEQRTGAATNDREKFATYLRDENTRLDYAQARYYSSTWARFTSADPAAKAYPGSPGSWNLYAYVEHDPVNSTDVTGLYLDVCADPIDGESNPICIARKATVRWEWRPNIPGTVIGSPTWMLVPVVIPGQSGTKVFDPTSLLPGMLTRSIELAKRLIEGSLSCQGIYNVSGEGLGPADMLNALMANGDIIYDRLKDDTWSAQTYSLVGGGVAISMNNSLSSNWFNGSEYDRAITVLHELGHVYDMLYGKGSSMLPADENVSGLTDEERLKRSTANTEYVKSNCQQ